MLNKVIDHQVAYYEFLRADGFPPILNEIGNFILAWGIFALMCYNNHLGIGSALLTFITVSQRVEAYYVGQEWLRNGKRLDMTKKYLLHRYGIG